MWRKGDFSCYRQISYLAFTVTFLSFVNLILVTRQVPDALGDDW